MRQSLPSPIKPASIKNSLQRRLTFTYMYKMSGRATIKTQCLAISQGLCVHLQRNSIKSNYGRTENNRNSRAECTQQGRTPPVAHVRAYREPDDDPPLRMRTVRRCTHRAEEEQTGLPAGPPPHGRGSEAAGRHGERSHCPPPAHHSTWPACPKMPRRRCAWCMWATMTNASASASTWRTRQK